MPTSSQNRGYLSNFRIGLLDSYRRLRGSLDWINPRCLLCGSRASADALCENCRTGMPWLDGTQCANCAHPLPLEGLCGRCIAEPPRYDRVIAACRYAYPLDALIQACKYGGRLVMIRALASLLPVTLPQRPDLIVAMPLSSRRLRERGFNQALELARHAARSMQAAIDADVCVRIRDTPPQSGLPWKQRRKNVRGAFVVRTRLDGLHVAVVDDVLTTGATLDALSRNLKQSGAASVSGLIVARTVAGGANSYPRRR